MFSFGFMILCPFENLLLLLLLLLKQNETSTKTPREIIVFRLCLWRLDIAIKYSKKLCLGAWWAQSHKKINWTCFLSMFNVHSAPKAKNLFHCFGSLLWWNSTQTVHKYIDFWDFIFPFVVDCKIVLFYFVKLNFHLWAFV